MLSLEEVRKLIEAEIRPLKTKISEYEEKIKELEKSQSFLSNQYDTLLKQIQGNNGKYAKIDRRVEDLRRDVDLSADEIEDLEQYLRRDYIKIFGFDPDMLREDLRLWGRYCIFGKWNGSSTWLWGCFDSPTPSNSQRI